MYIIINKMVLVVELMVFLIKFLAPVFKSIAYVLCIPHIYCFNAFESYSYNAYKNIGCLFFAFLTYFTYFMVLFNFHLVAFAYYILGEESHLKLIIAWFIINCFYKLLFEINSLTQFVYFGTIYKMSEIGFYLLFLLIILICLILCLGNQSMWDLLTFNRISSNLLIELSICFGILIYSVLANILVACHILHPLSLYRVYHHLFYSRARESIRDLAYSALFIIVDYLGAIALIINILFLKSYIRNTKQLIIKIKQRNQEPLELPRPFPYESQIYAYLTLDYIWAPFQKNIKLVFAIICCSLNLILVWRIKNVVRLLKIYFKTNDFHRLCISLGINIIDGLTEIAFCFIYFMNSVNPQARKLVSHLKIICEDEKQPNTIDIHLFVFIMKKQDTLATLIILLKLPFISFLGLFYKFPSWFEIFPLFEDALNLLNIVKLDNQYSTLFQKLKVELSPVFIHRRKIGTYETFLHIKVSTIFVISIILSLNPVLGFKYLYIIKDGINTILSSNWKKDFIQSIEDQSVILNSVIKSALHLNFVTLPAMLLTFLLSPWNVKSFFDYVKQNYSGKHFELSSDYSKNLALTESIAHKSLQDMLINLMEGWKNIVKFILVHLFIVRACLLYYDTNKAIAYSKKNSHSTGQSQNSSVSSSIANQYIYLSLRPSQNLTRISERGMFSIYLYFLHKHFKITIIEFWTYPFLIIYSLLTPWNFRYLFSVLDSDTFIVKVHELYNVSKKYVFYDLFVIIGTVVLILSGFQTFKTIRLVYYSLKRKILDNQLSHDEYDIYYRGSYKQEVFHLFVGIIKKVVTLVLLIINIILVLRAYKIVKRLSRFAMKSLLSLWSDYKKIKSYFYKSDGNKHKASLLKLKKAEITCISEFLSPASLTELSMVNRAVYNKMMSNYIWELQYKNYFSKKVNGDLLKDLSEKSFSHFKNLCFLISSKINADKTLSEADRDLAIGYFSVVIEETIDSILKFPHLVLIPIKILSIPTILLFYLVHKIFEAFYVLAFKIRLNRFLYLSLIELSLLYSAKPILEDYTNYKEIFYNFQIIAFNCLAKLILLIFVHVGVLLYSVLMIFIKLLCFTIPTVPESSAIQPNYSLNFLTRIVQRIYSIAWALFILLSPLLYHNSSRISYMLELSRENMAIHFITGYYELDSAILICYHLLSNILVTVSEKSIWWFLCKLCGPYFSNIIWWIIMRLVSLFLCRVLWYNESVVFVRMAMWLLRVENYFTSSYYIIFPHIQLLRYTKNSLLSNLIVLVSLVYPIYYFFTSSWTFFNFTLGIMYNIVNVSLLIK